MQVTFRYMCIGSSMACSVGKARAWCSVTSRYDRWRCTMLDLRVTARSGSWANRRARSISISG